jgi:voltage-gated potassium channel Kch
MSAEASPEATAAGENAASAKESQRKKRWEAPVEIVEVLVLAIVAVATSYSGYMAARWDGRQALLDGHASFTTLTTLGYGDYTAAYSSGQAVAVLEALVGQVFLATLVARLVAAFRAPANRQG